jgi:hypothetical protein
MSIEIEAPGHPPPYVGWPGAGWALAHEGSEPKRERQQPSEERQERAVRSERGPNRLDHHENADHLPGALDKCRLSARAIARRGLALL